MVLRSIGLLHVAGIDVFLAPNDCFFIIIVYFPSHCISGLLSRSEGRAHRRHLWGTFTGEYKGEVRHNPGINN